MVNTKIEWCSTLGPDGILYHGNTFNPWWGCMKVSPACKNCYAEAFANRFHAGLWGPSKTTPRGIASEKYWKQPLKWNAKAKKTGVQLKVFCASMADVFEDHPGIIDARKRLFDLIEKTPNLNWLLLTKRPENIRAMVPDWWLNFGFPNNVWMGTTIENQEYVDTRLTELLKVPARIRFISCEPLKGPLIIENGIISKYFVDRNGKEFRRINWCIAGGESGPHAEPSHPDWFRSLRDQCKAAGVNYFFKQWGEWAPGEFGRLYRERSIDYMDGIQMVKIGKRSAGRLLDGVEFNEMPV